MIDEWLMMMTAWSAAAVVRLFHTINAIWERFVMGSTVVNMCEFVCAQCVGTAI